jgi:hypothetical protein
MAKQHKLDTVLKARNPFEKRQVITPVDVLATEHPNGSDDRSERTETANGRTDRPTRTVEPTKRSEQANATSEREHRTVFEELEQGREETKRATERYSFEIYTDQKGSLEELQYLYKKRTGKKLSASRILREALEGYLQKAFRTFKESEA